MQGTRPGDLKNKHSTHTTETVTFPLHAEEPVFVIKNAREIHTTLSPARPNEGAAADRIFRSFSDPVRLFWYQIFRCSNSGILLLFETMVLKSRASQGLSTDVLHLWCKSPPLPQNSSAVVGNLK
jgi:hypothetical protein